MARLLSVNVGVPREVTWNGRPSERGLETPVNERRMARKLNIDGDAQGDLAGHGGEQRAVFVYQMDPTITGNTFWVAMILVSASSARTSRSKDFLMMRSA